MEKSEKKEENKIIKGLKDGFSGLASFVRDSRAELRKVQWLNRKEITTYTAIVVFVSLSLSFFIWLIDLGLSSIMQFFI